MDNESIAESSDVVVWLGDKFIPIAEVKKRIDEAKKVGEYGSCWVCGKVFSATDYECKHDFV